MASNDTNPFYDAIAEFYPLFFRDWAIQMEREGLGLRSIFRNRGVVSVLDASRGAGAQAIPLAQLGFQVTAADPSTGMLSKAREFAADYGVQDKITFLQGEFATLPQLVHGPFDAVVTKGTSLPHLLTDLEIERALQGFFTLLRPGGTLVIGMRDFAPFMEDRPRFIPGLSHEDENGYQFITFDLWDWRDGPPVLATQNLFIVSGRDPAYHTLRRRVTFRPLSTDEVKVVLLEVGFEEIVDQPDRTESVLIARRPLTLTRMPQWMKK